MNPRFVRSINICSHRFMDLRGKGVEGIDILSGFLFLLSYLPKLLNMQVNINWRSA